MCTCFMDLVMSTARVTEADTRTVRVSLLILLNGGGGWGVGVGWLAVNNSAFILMERTPFAERSMTPSA